MGAERAGFEVLVVGSGPAGTSCAQRLVAAGRHVALLDGGRLPAVGVPENSYMEYRRGTAEQPLLFGPDYGAGAQAGDESPKLRIPSLRYVFEGFAEAFQVHANGFKEVGSLAVGGMSNAWGAGVACFTAVDLAGWPLGRADLVESYRSVIRRIGVSGRGDDDLRDFFAWDEDLQAPAPLVEAAQVLLGRYARDPRRLEGQRFALGHARNAILTEDHAGRLACDRSGWCLWGCARRAIYSARYELDSLSAQPNFTHLPGRVVEEIARTGTSWVVRGTGPLPGQRFELSARHLALACGTIGTASLVLRALRLEGLEVRFSSCPSAAFAMIVPRMLGGALPERVFGSAQLSVVLHVEGLEHSLFGNIFSPAALPVSEFLARSPLPGRTSLAFFRAAMPALLVGNLFMPGQLSDHRLRLRGDGGVEIAWAYRPALDERLVRAIRRALAASLSAYGAYLVPSGFKPASPGSDMHYGGTVPMCAAPEAHQATPEGEVKGLPGVYVVDGSALPSLPAKAHALTIMANADRIAGAIDRRLAR